MAVYGGFAGTETERARRDPAAHSVVLSGDLNGNDDDLDGDGFPDDSTMEDNCYNVFYHPPELALTTSAVLDGVTIRGGYSFIFSLTRAGGGIFNDHCSPTITNCTIFGNFAYYYGGGIYNSDASPVITQCTISGNLVSSSSDANGGGIYNFSSSPVITGCNISGNAALAGVWPSRGGGIYNSNSSPAITNCTISNNSAFSAGQYSFGGGIYNSASSSPAITGCTISGNSASSSLFDAWFYSSGGGIYNSDSSPSITNCTLSNNSAWSGGAIRNTGGSPSISNCTLFANTASAYAGGILNDTSGTPLITNCVLWANSPASQITNLSATTPSVSHCVIQGGYGFAGGTNILTGDPLLLPLGNYGGPTPTMPLSSGSPAVDGGAAGSGVPVVDQRGFVRTGIPDIGACELSLVPTAAALASDHLQRQYREGTPAILTAMAEGHGLDYQWYSGPTPIPSATARTFETPPLTRGPHSFWVRVTYGGGQVDAPPVILTAVPPVLKVSPLGQDSNDGSTWAAAFRTLEHALQVAAPGCEIWLAQGTYKPNDASGSSNRDQWFQMREAVSVYGGFSGTETSRAQRDPGAHPAILSGDLLGNDADPDSNGFPDASTLADNCYHVFYHPSTLGLTAGAVLDGVTLRGGNADGTFPHNSGGGICNVNSAPSFVNCTLVGNVASSYGGGIYNYCSRPAITGCTISSNLTTSDTTCYGGGIHNSSSSPAITNCTLVGNSVFSSGGESSYGGGISNYLSSPPITNCMLSGNSASTHGVGGGIYNLVSSAAINGCTFSDNSAASGGAIYNSNSDSTFVNCTLASNSATSGGGIYNSGTSSISHRSPTIANCTFSGNSASSSGGGIYNYSSSPAITNCILWGGSPAMQIFNSSSTPTVSYCVIQGGYAGGTNILSINPLLFPLGNNSGPTLTMPIGGGSPAIDAGTAGTGIPTTDQRGFARTGAPDVGACEFQTATWAGADPAAPSAIGSALNASICSDYSGATYQWYLGSPGDTSHPIAGATGATLSYGPLEQGVHLWVRITPGSGSSINSSGRLFEVRGTYDQWCDFHGLTGADRDAAACPAGDGISNLVKFAVALDPVVPSGLDTRSLCEYDRATGTLKQQWVLSKTPADLGITGEWSPDLQMWSSAGVTQTILESDTGTETREVSVPMAGQARGFLRLHLEKAP